MSLIAGTEKWEAPKGGVPWVCKRCGGPRPFECGVFVCHTCGPNPKRLVETGNFGELRQAHRSTRVIELTSAFGLRDTAAPVQARAPKHSRLTHEGWPGF